MCNTPYFDPVYLIPALAWFTGNTRTSAIFTCGGRAAAQTISSAISSAVTTRMILSDRVKHALGSLNTHGAQGLHRPS